jgi:ribokinase
VAAVVVLGSVNVDLVVAGARLPQAGETVTGGRFERHHGGKGGNQAVAAARALRGGPAHGGVAIVGAVGDDDLGREAIAALEAEGVDCSALAVRQGMATGVALIVVDDAGENQIAVAPGANATLSPAEVEKALPRLLGRETVLLACLEVPIGAVLAGALAARAAGACFVLNPAPAQQVPFDLLRLAGVVTPNEHEVSRLIHDQAGAEASSSVASGSAGTEATPEDHARALWARLPGLRCVVTLGSRGAFLVGPETSQGCHVAALSVHPADTTGAGDALNGALAAALAEGRTLSEAVARGVVAGGLATARIGAREALPLREEIDRAGASETVGRLEGGR